MNTSENTQNPRPFGYWIKATDRLMAAAFADAFEAEDVTRRDWRLLNVIDGSAPAARPLHPGKLRRLVERGWIERTSDGWALTDDGRSAKERLGALVENIRATVTDAAGPDDLATTIATLEKIARAFGWDENTPLPRRRGRDFGHRPRGFGRRHGRPFGRGFGSGFGSGSHPGFGAGFHPGFGSGSHPGFADADREGRYGHPCGHGFGPEHGHGFEPEHGHGFGPEYGHARHCGDHGGHHGEHGEHHGKRHGEYHHHRAHRAYERGFDAGFARGRDA